jgi:methionine-rich copper-binding protein CopC
MVPSLHSVRRSRVNLESLEARLAPAANPVVTENALPGNPQSEWGINGSGDPTLQGYATNFSVNKGETVSFKITDETLAAYRIDIYRIGYYQGNGARRVATIPSSQTLRQNQPAPLYTAATNLVDAGNWAVSASWAVPATAVSGVHIARLVREDTGSASHIIFVVRDDTSQSDILFQTADTTWQAYNGWGGWSLYGGTNGNRAYKVSYNRPFNTRTNTVNGRDFFFGVEYAQVRWLEANGYNVSYFSGLDGDRYGSEILEHKTYMTAGHDEYWSGPQRNAVQAARDAGVNLAFFTGNDMYWKVRWENSTDGSNTPYRTMVGYKESLADAKIDPNPTSWTGLWRDARFSPPADGGKPENALTGTIWTVNRGPGGETGTSMNVPEAEGKMRFWRDTSVAGLADGQTAVLGDQVLGYEWNEDLDNGYRPTGLFRLSSTTQTVPEKILDLGKTVGVGTATHSLTQYRAASGALVFSAGTVQWAWGLDSVHDGPVTTPSLPMRQATVNLLADMGVQPETLQSDLVRAAASTDASAPTTTITSHANGASFTTGQTYTISGIATDGGGGRVAAVEVSTDGGQTWHRATGRGSWTYSWTPATSGPVTLRARAVDDSSNLEDLGATVTGNAILAATSTTGLIGAWAFNGSAADAAGGDNPGTVSGAVYTPSGRYGQALSFDGSNDWVTVADAAALDFTSALTLEAWVRPASQNDFATVVMKESSTGMVYGLYASDGANNPPSAYLIANNDPSVRGSSVLPVNAWSHLATTYDGSSLKIYVNGELVGTQAATGNISTSPDPLRIGGNEFWGEWFSGLIDEVRVYNRALGEGEIRYDMSTPIGGSPDATLPTGSINSPSAGSTVSGTVNLSASASDNVLVSGVRFYIDGQPVGTEDISAPYTFAWDSRKVMNGTHTVTARIRDGVGNVFDTPAVSITVGNPADTTAPTVKLTLPGAGTKAGGPVVLQAAAADNIAVVGVQFKVNGVNVGSEDTVAPFRLAWDASAAAEGTYDVVAVAKDLAGNTTTSTAVQVVVDKTAPTISTKTPTAGATNVATTNSSVSVTFSEAVDVTSLVFTLKDAANVTIAGQLTYNEATRTATFAPTTLSLSTVYTATVGGVKDLAGNPLAGTTTWSFTTTGAVINNTLFDSAAAPTVASVDEALPVELGVKIRTDVAGYLTGVRFYKGVNNTGPHVGKVWDLSGNLLGSVTFTNETATGWQQADFATPVAVAAGTTYVVSYYAPNGGFAITGGFFASALISDHLTALADAAGGNGVYRYGAGGGYPNLTHNAANYWVDVVFSNVLTDQTGPTISTKTPAAGATDVAWGTGVSATFSEAVQSSSISIVLKDANQATVAGSAAYNPTTRTITFQPTNALAINATYTATVSGAQDTAGNTMAPVTWAFTTMGVDTTAPTVAGKTPAANATAVAPAEEVTVTFSESVQSNTISLVVLDQNNVPVPANLTYNDVTRTVSVRPIPPTGLPAGCCGTCSHCPLAAATQYTATISGAKDAAGNTMAPVTWSFTTDNAILGVNVWDGSATPAVASANDPDAVELGVKIRSEKTGYITGVRFYKGAFNTGTHLGRVWSGEGTLLDTVTFTNESSSGWQQANFTNPILAKAGTTYIVSYYAPNGGYAYTHNYFATEAGTGVLKAPATGAGGPNGLYRYGAGGGFPTQSYNSTNYWVDAVFSNILADTIAPTITARTPAANATGIAVSSTVSITFDEAIRSDAASVVLKDVSGTVVPGSLTFNDAKTVFTLTPGAFLATGASYTVTVTGAMDATGNTMAPVTWSFTTAGTITNATIWGNDLTPTVPSAADPGSVELGVKFRSQIAGYATGVRFYKGAANTGTHVGKLWDTAGNLLGSVTFTNETATGWQSASFATPIALAANTSYIISYFAPNGGYSYNHGFFAGSGYQNNPLYVLSSGEAGGNGLYLYGPSGGFPNQSYNSTNYWVDVVFSETVADTVSPTVTAKTPAPGATGALPAGSVSVTFNEDVQAGSIVLQLEGPSGTVVPATVTYNAATRTATLVPAGDLSPVTVYTAKVSGAKDTIGNQMAGTVSWTFTTANWWKQTTTADFAGGAAAGTEATGTAGGGVALAATLADQFTGTALNGSAWSVTSWGSGGAVNVAAGAVNVVVAQLKSTGSFSGRAAEGRINFGASQYQHFGVATDLSAVEGHTWALFSTKDTSNALFARVNVNGAMTDVNLGELPTGFHNYRIRPTGTGVDFYVDGILQTTINTPLGTTPLHLVLSDFLGNSATPLIADWMRVIEYPTAGTLTSTVFDAGAAVAWGLVNWGAVTPAGTSIVVETRTGNTAQPDGSWSNWAAAPNGQAVASPSGRYIQYRVTLSTTNPEWTPELLDLSITW